MKVRRCDAELGAPKSTMQDDRFFFGRSCCRTYDLERDASNVVVFLELLSISDCYREWYLLQWSAARCDEIQSDSVFFPFSLISTLVKAQYVRNGRKYLMVHI